MGEYCDNAFGNMSPVQKDPDGSTVHYEFKDSYLFTYGTINKTEDFFDENLSLSREDKFKILDFLNGALRKDYSDFEKLLLNKQSRSLKMVRDTQNATEEKLSSAKKVSVICFFALFFAAAFSAGIWFLYSAFSTFLPWRWPEICVTIAYIILWFLLYALLNRKFCKTDADILFAHGVFVVASYDIAIFLLLIKAWRLNWLAAVSFLIALVLSVDER